MDIFGVDVFNEGVMAERLPKKTFVALKKTIENGEELDAMVAEVVANAMKDWAIERGATHYTHRQRDCRGHEAVGRGARGHSLHPLVPADDGGNRGET